MFVMVVHVIVPVDVEVERSLPAPQTPSELTMPMRCRMDPVAPCYIRHIASIVTSYMLYTTHCFQCYIRHVAHCDCFHCYIRHVAHCYIRHIASIVTGRPASQGLPNLSCFNGSRIPSWASGGICIADAFFCCSLFVARADRSLHSVSAPEGCEALLRGGLVKLW